MGKLESIRSRSNMLFIILASFFLANTLLAEFVGVKIFSLESTLGWAPLDWTIFGVEHLGLNLTAGVVLWPVVFVMTDIINEYFGQRNVKLLSYIAVGVVFYSFLMVYFTIQLDPSPWWQNESGLLDKRNPISDMDAAFKKIMGQGLWIIIGSMVAFLIGQVVDVTVFHKIKNMTGERLVWLRATGSTLISQFIDSFVVLFIAFYIGADWSLSMVLAIGIVNYIYKFVMAIILTPVIYLAHFIIDRYLGEALATEMKLEANMGI